MDRAIIVSALMLSISVMTGSATTEVNNPLEDRELYTTACAPMNFAVGYLRPDVQETGLTREALINMAESRLRAARLFAPLGRRIHGRQHLDIKVHIVGRAFHADLELVRYLDDLGYGRGGSPSFGMMEQLVHTVAMGSISSVLCRHSWTHS